MASLAFPEYRESKKDPSPPRRQFVDSPSAERFLGVIRRSTGMVRPLAGMILEPRRQAMIEKFAVWLP